MIYRFVKIETFVIKYRSAIGNDFFIINIGLNAVTGFQFNLYENFSKTHYTAIKLTVINYEWTIKPKH